MLLLLTHQCFETTCSRLLSVAVINTKSHCNLEKKGFVWLTTPGNSLPHGIGAGSQSRNLQQEPQGTTALVGLVSGLRWLSHPVQIRTMPRDSSTHRGGSSHINHQLRRSLRDTAIGQSALGNSCIEAAPSQVTLAVSS